MLLDWCFFYSAVLMQKIP